MDIELSINIASYEQVMMGPKYHNWKFLGV